MKKLLSLLLAGAIILSLASLFVAAENVRMTEAEIEKHISQTLESRCSVHDQLFVKFNDGTKKEAAVAILHSEWAALYPNDADKAADAVVSFEDATDYYPAYARISVKNADMKQMFLLLYKHDEVLSVEVERLIPATDKFVGDANYDGKVDATDCLVLKRYILGTLGDNRFCFDAADIDNNRVIDAVDYLLLKRAYLGTYSLPAYR